MSSFKKFQAESNNALIDKKIKIPNDVIIYYESIDYIVFRSYSYNSNKMLIDNYIKNTIFCTAYSKKYYSMHSGADGLILYCINKLETNKSIAIEKVNNGYEIWLHDGDVISLDKDQNVLNFINNRLKSIFINDSNILDFISKF